MWHAVWPRCCVGWCILSTQGHEAIWSRLLGLFQVMSSVTFPVWLFDVWCGVVWCGVVWCGVVWCGVAWCGVVWCGVAWCGVVWCGVVRCGAVWCGVVRCGVAWCGAVRCGAVRCGVVWCDVVCTYTPSISSDHWWQELVYSYVHLVSIHEHTRVLVALALSPLARTFAASPVQIWTVWSRRWPNWGSSWLK